MTLAIINSVLATLVILFAVLTYLLKRELRATRARLAAREQRRRELSAYYLTWSATNAEPGVVLRAIERTIANDPRWGT